MDECEVEAIKHFGQLLKTSAGRRFAPANLQYEYQNVCMRLRGFVFDDEKKRKDDQSLPAEGQSLLKSRWSPRYWKRDDFPFIAFLRLPDRAPLASGRAPGNAFALQHPGYAKAEVLAPRRGDNLQTNR